MVMLQEMVKFITLLNLLMVVLHIDQSIGEVRCMLCLRQVPTDSSSDLITMMDG